MESLVFLTVIAMLFLAAYRGWSLSLIRIAHRQARWRQELEEMLCLVAEQRLAFEQWHKKICLSHLSSFLDGG